MFEALGRTMGLQHAPKSIEMAKRPADDGAVDG
jgi:hypothetical protein